MNTLWTEHPGTASAVRVPHVQSSVRLQQVEATSAHLATISQQSGKISDMSLPPDTDRQPTQLHARLRRIRDRQLADMLQTAQHLERLQRLAGEVLNDPALEFQLTAVEQGTLRLQTSSAAMATRLRYQQRVLLRELSRHLRTPLRRLEVRIAPPARPATRPPGAPPTGISRQGAEQLQMLAEGEPDPALRQALEHLARRVRDD